LEFNTVFLPAWEEGIFPNEKTTKEGDLEEERRLAYVAITRARQTVVITNAMVRSLFGQRLYQTQSRFIGEIDKEFINNNNGDTESRRDNHVHQSRKIDSCSNASLVGKMISHNEMGIGVVIAENTNVLTVAFKTKGIKNVMRDFVKII